MTGDPSTPPPASSRRPVRARSCSARATYQLVRDAVDGRTDRADQRQGQVRAVCARTASSRSTPSGTGHARRLDAPLVGRDRELERLGHGVPRDGRRSARASLVTLLGPAGIGKSRLVAEFAAAAELEATVLRGRCLSYGEGITYWPIGEIVRTAAGIDDADSAEAARAKLRRCSWRRARRRRRGEHGSPARSACRRDAAPQEEVFWAIRKLFEHLARDRPLVVVIEDIHWAEPTLLDLIEHVADWSRDAPILLLCPARPELLDDRAGWGGGTLNATTILLEPLGARRDEPVDRASCPVARRSRPPSRRGS